MADQSKIRAGGAEVELGADNSKLIADLRAAATRLKSWGESVTSLGLKIFSGGALATGGLLGTAKVFADSGSALNDLADRTGFAVEELSALKFAAEQSGATVEDLETAIKFMQKGGFGEGAADFARLANQIQNAGTETEKTQMAMRFFGRSGTNLKGMLKDGADGLKAYSDEAHAAGIIMSKDSAAAADRLGDAIDKLKAQLGAMVVVIGAALAPMLTELLADITPIIAGTISWIRENRGLVQSAFQVAASITAIGVGIVAGGLAMKVIGIAIAAWISPIGLVVTAIGGITAAVLLMSEATVPAFQGIRDALMAGDLLLAAKVLWAGLKAIWAEGIGNLQLGWMRMTSFFQDAFANLVLGLKLIWTDWIKDFQGGIVALRFHLGLINRARAVRDFNALGRKKEEDRNAAIAVRDAEAKRIELALNAKINAIRAEQKAAMDELEKFKNKAAFQRNLMNAPRMGMAREALAKGRELMGGSAGTFSAAQALRLAGNTGILEKQLDRLDRIIANQKKALQRKIDQAMAVFV